MTFVCLWSPDAPTAAASATELAAALLRHTPRLFAKRPGLVWADGRGLDARALAPELLAALRDAGAGASRAGIAATPIAAEVAAVHGGEEIALVAPGEDRAFLAPWPISVLEPPRELLPALDGTGIERCGDLARLAREAVEVRFGALGLALWRLARADDLRPLFQPVPRALPHASLAWSEYLLHDCERLLFVVNRLAGSVCAALHELGEGATAFTLGFALANGRTLDLPFHPSRTSADQRAWMRLMRDALDRVQLEDGVTGLTLTVDAVRGSECVQGDILDRGFASAGAAAEALARVLDGDAAALRPERTRHPLARRRTRWIAEQPSFVWARPQIGGGDTDPEIALYLLPEPETVEAVTVDRQGFAVPVRYRGHDGEHELVAASGPDCISGGQWEEAYAFEAYCCVRADGELVQLCRDAMEGRWRVEGVWR